MVEDNPGDADLIREMLPATEENGFTVHCVTRLAEAVSHLKNVKTDIALLDLDLPDSRGVDTVRKARKAAPGMPIVVLTGNEDERIGIEAVQGGAQDFLVKGQTHQSQLSRVLRYAVERHYAEQQMRESEHFLRSTLDALSAQIAIIDPSGEIIAANKAWKDFARIHGDHVMRCGEGANYFDTCKAMKKEKSDVAICAKSFAQGIQAVIENKADLYELEYSMQSPGGELWFHGQVTPFPNDHKRRVVISHEDITGRKRAEEEKLSLASQLRHTHKMEAIGTLAGGIAHDFNNILSSVIGFVELSLMELEDGSQLERNLKEVYQAGTRAKELVQQILTFARSEESHIQPTQISAIAQEAFKLIRSTIPTSIEMLLTNNSEAFAMVEPAQIHQIFMNLMTNAAQAMDRDGGVLSVQIEEMHLKCFRDSMHKAFKPGDYFKITVADTGSGIPPDEMEKIFDPYFTTKGGGEGTGLGLSVVHGIVRNHGGEIAVESEVGRGTVFTLYLPLSALKAMPDVDAYRELPMGSERILFVDDEVPITEMNRQRLSLLGYNVTSVNNSIEALQRLTETPDAYDLIITDMTMPQMSGEQLAVEAKKLRPVIPVILCTGYSKKISEEKADAIGVSALLMKPVSIRDMAETIRMVLGDTKG